jgi:hypothetical protein
MDTMTRCSDGIRGFTIMDCLRLIKGSVMREYERLRFGILAIGLLVPRPASADADKEPSC